MNWFKRFWKALTTPAAPASRVTVPPRQRIILPRAGQTSPAFPAAVPESTANFTPRAQHVLVLARKEADRFNHNFIGTEHLLLGIIRLGQGTAVTVLQKMGLDLEAVRMEVEKQVGTGPDQKMIGNIPYTPRARKVLALAGKEAAALRHTYVGTEHILLGLLREGDGVGARVLLNLDVNLEQTREMILQELDPNYSPAGGTTEPKPTSGPASTVARPPSPGTDVLSAFTPRAQQVLALARKEADRMHQSSVGSEHLLLGLLALGTGVAVNVLHKRGLQLETVRREVEKLIGTVPEQKIVGNIPYSPQVKMVLSRAAKQAVALRHTYVGTEHILLGLLQETEGPAAGVLKNLGVNVDETRQEILSELDSDHRSASPHSGPAPSASAPPSPKSTTLRIAPSSPAPEELVDLTRRYDVYCSDWSQGITVYRNVRFKALKYLFHRHQYDGLSGYIELELSDGQTIHVFRSSVLKFHEHGATPGSSPAESQPQ